LRSGLSRIESYFFSVSSPTKKTMPLKIKGVNYFIPLC